MVLHLITRVNILLALDSDRRAGFAPNYSNFSDEKNVVFPQRFPSNGYKFRFSCVNIEVLLKSNLARSFCTQDPTVTSINNIDSKPGEFNEPFRRRPLIPPPRNYNEKEDFLYDRCGNF